MAARAETSSMLQLWQSQHGTDRSCGISRGDSTDAFVRGAGEASSRNLMSDPMRLIQARAGAEKGCDWEAASLSARRGWKGLVCLALQN